MATDKQIEANRRNAQRSTGPKTDEGKAASRRNALTHGLSGSDDTRSQAKQAEIAERTEAWAETLKPGDDYESWLVGQVAIASVMIDTAEAEALQLTQRLIERAEVCWSKDRAADVTQLAKKLGQAPELYRIHLMTSRAGVEWMLDRWQELDTALDRQALWTEEQVQLAQDLMGVHPAFRDKESPIPLADKTNPIPEWKALVEHEIQTLRSDLAEGLEDLDASDRNRALRGFFLPSTPSLLQNHRYLDKWQRKLTWALNEFRKVQEGRQKPAKDVVASLKPMMPLPTILPSEPPPPTPALATANAASMTWTPTASELRDAVSLATRDKRNPFVPDVALAHVVSTAATSRREAPTSSKMSRQQRRKLERAHGRDAR